MITEVESWSKGQELLVAEGLDAFVVASPANVRYFAGTSFVTMRTIPDRLGLVVVTAGTTPTFVYCSIEEGHVAGESWLTSRVPYTEFVESPVAVLARWLNENGLAASRVGVEMHYLTAHYFGELQELVPHAAFVSVDRQLAVARAVKTPAELQTVISAAYYTDEAIRAALSGAVAGQTERAVADEMVAESLARGAVRLSHQTVATGANAGVAHPVPGSALLRPGDVLRTDFGMYWEGEYLSDVARTAFVGSVSKQQTELYQRLDEVQRNVATGMRAGVRACDVFYACARAMDSAGLDFWLPHVGHSIGLELHEQPMLQPHDQTELREGMVFMLEPLITAPDGYYHAEDLVVVGPDEGAMLSRSANWSDPLVIDGAA